MPLLTIVNSRVRNDLFDASVGYRRGGWGRFIVWQLLKWAFFRTSFPWPSAIKCGLLRLMGATVGRGVVIKPMVNIHLPWKLIVGDHVWLGEEAFILNFEEIRLGDHVCISQRAFLCGGNHDYRDPCMSYRNGPITVGDGAWVGAQVFVGPGVVIGRDAVVGAGGVVSRNLEAGKIYRGNPALPVGLRWKE